MPKLPYSASWPSLLLLLTLGCTPPAAITSACIDPARINPSGICTMQYDPVCGCDGKTYGNGCTAQNAGVTSFTKGECPPAPKN